MTNTKTSKKDKLFFTFVLFAEVIILLLISLPKITNFEINYDSSYQYFLNQHSISEIWSLLPYDYSPPFYAMSLKLFTMVFGDSLIIMRLYSLLPVIIMLILALFPVKKLFGKYVSILFSIAILCASYNDELITEIRPTIYAVFFFFCFCFCAYRTFFNNVKYDYILITVFTVMCMYTHNVAMFGCVCVYIICCILSLLRKSNAQCFKFILCGIVSSVIYLPWLKVVMSQFGNVQNNFWESSTDTLILIFRAFFISCFSANIMMIIYVLIIIFAVYNLLLIRKRKENAKQFLTKRKESVYKLAFIFLIAFAPASLFIIFTKAVYPLGAQRYFYIFAPEIFLFISYIATRFNTKKLMCILLSIIMIGNLISTQVQYHNYVKDDTMTDMIDLIKSNESDETDIAFLHMSEGTLGIMLYYFPNAKHYVCKDTFTVLNTYDVFNENVIEIDDASEVFNYEDYVYTFEYGLNQNIDLMTCLTKSNYPYKLNELGQFYQYLGFYHEFPLCKVEKTVTEGEKK